MGIVAKVRDASLIVIIVAIAIRLASWAIAPFVPYAIVIVILLTIMMSLSRRT